MIQNYLMVRLQSSTFGEYGRPFITIALRFTLTRSGHNWWGPIYGLNRIVWHLNCVQTNNLCEIRWLKIELFDYLSV